MKLPGLDRRTAYYLIKIDRAFSPLGIDSSVLASTGWTKLAYIAKHVTPDNIMGLLALAQSCTAYELRAKLDGKAIPSNARIVLLYLTTEQHSAYAKTLIKYGAKAAGKGLVEQEAALMNLINEAKSPR